MAVMTRVKSAWNAFFTTSVKRETEQSDGDAIYSGGSGSFSVRPDRPTLRFYNDRSIVSSIYTRMSIDVSDVDIRHVKFDDQNRYVDDVNSLLNLCLTYEPNMDQGPRSFRQDISMTLFDKGVAAIVPIDTTQDPEQVEEFDVISMRVGEIVAWYPKHVRVSVYNENLGRRQEVTLLKKYVAIIENPLHLVMNAPNSTLQRLIRKLQLLDVVDEQSSSGKLDLIIQLPYTIKSEARRQQAEQRRQDIEFQLKGSQYGIAYTDGTERITQLNRPAENNLLKQVEFLTNLLYSQLGITEDVMNGTADEKTMLNYFNRTVKPILDAIIQGMQRSLLGLEKTRKAERIRYFRDPFAFVPVSSMAELADKFGRNEVVSSNEIRGFLGMKPHKDPKADELRNSNMPQSTGTQQESLNSGKDSQNGS